MHNMTDAHCVGKMVYLLHIWFGLALQLRGFDSLIHVSHHRWTSVTTCLRSFLVRARHYYNQEIFIPHHRMLARVLSGGGPPINHMNTYNTNTLWSLRPLKRPDGRKVRLKKS